VTDVVIDLPVPLSVNKLRRINWDQHKRAQAWRAVANNYLMVAKRRPVNPIRFDRIERFEMTVELDEKSVKSDPDNCLKMLIDYLVSVNIIKNDAPQNMRRLVVEWADLPLGCRVTIKPIPLTMKDVARNAATVMEAAL